MSLLNEQLQANLQGDFAKGWQIALQLQEQQPDCNRAAFNRGWHLLQQGDLQKGMQLLDRGRWENVYGSKPLNSSAPIWSEKNDDIKGKTILLRGEGGLGDEIIHLRFAKDFAKKGAKVIVSADKGFLSLFNRAEGVSAVVQREAELAVHFDYWVPAMSAAHLVGHSFESLPDLPYLSARPERTKAWQQIINKDELRVGIRWAGNPRFEHEQFRRFPAQPLIELQKLTGVQLYSLQRDHDTTMLPHDIVDLRNLLTNWEETAAAISLLDLVITSCTSVAHLAAAMGKATWVVIPILPYYIWALPGDRSPWYGSVRLFRQQKFKDWQQPLDNVKKALEQLRDQKL